MAETKTFVSSFGSGLNTDADPRNQPPGTYREAVNMTITGKGTFYAAENIRGSENIADLLPADSFVGYNVLGTFACDLLDKSVSATQPVKAQVVFLAYKDSEATQHNRIFFVKLESGTVVELTLGDTDPDEDGRNGLNFPFDGTIDAVVFGERGYSNIYFEDGVNPLRKLPCYIGDADPLTNIEPNNVRSLTSARYNPVDDLRYQEGELCTSLGGNLPSGSYQFAYAWYDKVRNTQSAWSPLTNPLPIYPDEIPTGSLFGIPYASPIVISGGVPGEATKKQINLFIFERTENANAQYYNSILLAVVKNVTGTKEPAQTASITAPIDIIREEGVISFSYKGNGTESSVDIAEIVVQDADIQAAKTLVAKDNILFRGNLSYADRLLDLIEQPDLSAQEIVQNVGKSTLTSPVNGNYGYKSPYNCAQFRGHFRDETYRLGLVYADEFSRRSNPVPLDFEGVAGQTSPDWKFSDRRNKPILDAAQNEILALGLRITGIKNHPSWAKTLEVVRVPRLKNILYQSPHIPIYAAMPATKVANADAAQSWVNDTYGSAVPGTFLPKPLMLGAAKNLLRPVAQFFDGEGPMYYLQDQSSTPHDVIVQGSVPISDFHKPLPLSFLVPPDYLYNQNATNGGAFFDVDIAGKSLKMVDAASFYRSSVFPVGGIYSTGTPVIADNDFEYDASQDRLALSFEANVRAQYYYKGPSTPLFTAVDLQGFFPALGKTSVLFSQNTVYGANKYTLPLAPAGGNGIMGSINTAMDGENTSLYNKGNVFKTQRGIFVVLGEVFGDMGYLAKASAPVIDFGSAIAQTAPSHFYDNYTQTDPIGTPDGDDLYLVQPDNRIEGGITLNSSAAFVTPIVNVENGLDNKRYGALTTPYAYQYTGTQVDLTALTEDEIENGISVDVWGGDCFVTNSAAKINDTHLYAYWSLNPSTYTSTGESVQDYKAVTKALADAEEVLSCYLESEVNTDLGAQRFVYPRGSNYQSLPLFSNEFRYDYNFGYSVQNVLKTYQGRDFNAKKQLRLPARFAFSDQKVYQTTVEGFDRYRVSSIYDLDESYGALTKLILDKDNRVFGLQERALTFIPINESVVEQQKGERSLVNSNVLVNKPEYFFNNVGCQHVRAVATTQKGFAFADVRNREVYEVSGGRGERISEKGRSAFFMDLLSTAFADVQYGMVYDFGKEQLLFTVGSAHHVFDERADEGKGAWTGEVKSIQPIARFGNPASDLLAIGKQFDGALSVHRLYATDFFANLLGADNDSFITAAINPQAGVAKTFDVLALDATERMNTATYSVSQQGDSYPTQTCQVDLYKVPRQILYEYPVLRDVRGGRLRGFYALVKISMVNHSATIPYRRVRINSIIHKYRESQRIL